MIKSTKERVTEQDLLDIGFTKIPHFTVMNSLIYDLGRNRQLSVSNVGTPNEMFSISELNDKDKRKVTDVVILNNYDYDGYITIENLKTFISIIGKNTKNW